MKASAGQGKAASIPSSNLGVANRAFRCGASIVKVRATRDRGVSDRSWARRLCARCRWQLLGVIEAKKVTLGPQNVLTQAERYSKGVGGTGFSADGYRVPFLYSTNGEVFWFQDIRNKRNRSRQTRGRVASGVQTPPLVITRSD